MKKSISSIALWVFVLVPLMAQQKVKQQFTKPDPARGHYRQLLVFSPKPGVPREADNLKFPFDATAAQRRLSLKPVYLTSVLPEDFDLPEPPANSSEQTRAELNYLLGLQQHRTEDEERSALYKAGVYYNPRIAPTDSAYERYRRNLFYIGRSIGTWFNPETLPKTADLMANVWCDASYFIWTFKYKFLRVRPYVLEPELKNPEETNWAAYPSGHAANSYINAYLYMELAPDFRDAFIKDAYDMAHSREIIGVHYPSDSEASRIFARQFVNKLFQNDKFRKDFAEVKAEWEQKARESFSKPTGAPVKQSGRPCSKSCE